MLFRKKNIVFLAIMSILVCVPIGILAQNKQAKRIKPPKRKCKIRSVDDFVGNSFKLYDKVFVYDSLTQKGVEIPSELEDELAKRAEQDLDSLVNLTPDVAEDILDASFLKQAKATANLNKAKKALKFCGTAVKTYFTGTEEEED